ncbi:amino acid ABC transporter ATP-binding protein [Pseudazoarcus pumilus]|uniref:Amino acid ABC transporter ATP-binding protein n=1 Tax=Pseudazoarcus pumilus TaxID=2067960 RepID=A0A2I6S5S4_9RHOO|nr:amino acid ABC transporter ATP-binding protein [Pseudazoarcus pumilus]AUN94613.1 amino acid ABC transporter ATP-binding protein [Pseudazoarcus pumilus]
MTQTSENSVLLEVRGLIKRFDDKPVLNGVDLVLPEGQIKMVMGPSGCGKSTLLRCINRLIDPCAGQVIFRGEDVTRADTDVRLLRQRIGFVFQHFALYRHLSALDNVTLGLRKLRGMSRADAVDKAMAELARMNMAEHAAKYPSQLSGGQKQRVAIARALAMDPAVLFFDEPTSALDPLMSREIVGVIDQLCADNVTMLCVTHDVDLARAIEGNVVFLDEGMVRAEGGANALFEDHDDPRIRAFFSRDRRS